jgi:hypothetical protein
MEMFTRFSDVRLAGVALLSERAIGGTGKRIEGVKRGVQGPRDFVRRCCFLAMLSVPAACADLGDTFEVSPFLREQITGDSWRACLAREYQLQARAQVRSGRNWDEATRLAAKGRAALDGAEVTPTDPTKAEFTATRARLDAALSSKARNPCECATAQARFDGWVETERRDGDTAAFPAAFDSAVKACEAPR